METDNDTIKYILAVRRLLRLFETFQSDFDILWHNIILEFVKVLLYSSAENDKHKNSLQNVVRDAIAANITNDYIEFKKFTTLLDFIPFSSTPMTLLDFFEILIITT